MTALLLISLVCGLACFYCSVIAARDNLPIWRSVFLGAGQGYMAGTIIIAIIMLFR